MVANAVLTGNLRPADNYMLEPINTATDGTASCIKANYYKMGGANLSAIRMTD